MTGAVDADEERKNSATHIAPTSLQNGYHDYSVVPDSAFATPTELALGYERLMANTAPSFPVILHRVLEVAETEGHEDIVRWEAHGR